MCICPRIQICSVAVSDAWSQIALGGLKHEVVAVAVAYDHIRALRTTSGYAIHDGVDDIAPMTR